MLGFLQLFAQPVLAPLPQDRNSSSILTALPSHSLPHPRKAGLGWPPRVLWWAQSYQLQAGQLAAGSWQGPVCPCSGATTLTCSSQLRCWISQKSLTASCRQFKLRAQLYLQTYTVDLNFNIVLLSDLQGRFWLQYFALSTGTKTCVPAIA